MSASEARGADRRRRRWRRSLVAVLTVLVVAVAGLTVGATLRGPRITGVELDRAALVQRDGTRIVIELDQPLAARPRVEVTPSVDVSVALSGRSLALTFPRMLDYDTAYRIRIPDAVGAATGARSSLETRFTSADAQVYSLVRDPGGTDRIVRRALGGGSLSTVYAAKRIQRFAVLPAQIAVVTIDGTGDGTLVLVPLDGSGRADPVTGPSGAIDLLSASGPTGLLSYAVTSDTLDAALQVVDPTDGSGVARQVDASGSAAVSAVQTQWVPGTTSLLARADDASLSLVDASGRTAAPAGSASELRGIIPGTDRAVLADPDGGRTLDLRTGRTRTFTLPSDGLGAGPSRSSPIVLDAAGRYLEVVSRPTPDFSRTDFRVVEVSTDGARTLWRPALASTRIDRVCLSPNAEYLSVELVPRGAESDDYPGRPLYPSGSTSVVDLSTGEATRSLPGADPSWCSSGASADG